MTRTPSLLALVALAPAAQAFIVIDDFTVGEHHHTMGGFDNSWGFEQRNLDPNHVLFGYRATQMTIQQNFFNVPVQIDIGIGETRVSTSREVSSTMRTQYVDESRIGADLSFGDRIEVDLYTLDPPNRIGDSYFVIVRDADLTLRVVNNWLFRQGGVYFRKSDFGTDVDWSKIISFTFGQRYSDNFGAPPLTYGLTRIAIVPEPGTLLVAGLGLASALTGRRRRRCARPSAKPRL
jgi:hypothetical protein